jgi:uncharacterized protein (TIGR03435 family)
LRQVLLLAACVFFSAGVGVNAQTRPEFEAASVKPAAPDVRNTAIFMPPGGRLEVINMTLKAIIENAYNIQPFQISGGPGWMDSDHYDISAKSEKPVTREEILRMLQSLLSDRFRVTVRRQIKELQLYALVVARKDGKLGPRLIESKEGGCTEPDPANPLAADPMRLCGHWMLSPDGMTLVSAPVSKMIPLLSRLLGRQVLDKTGLAKNFDINIEWDPDQFQAMQLPRDGQRRDSNSPAIFTVFREQLGLEFKTQKGPVEVFVVERAEKPSGN